MNAALRRSASASGGGLGNTLNATSSRARRTATTARRSIKRTSRHCTLAVSIRRNTCFSGAADRRSAWRSRSFTTRRTASSSYWSSASTLSSAGTAPERPAPRLCSAGATKTARSLPSSIARTSGASASGLASASCATAWTPRASRSCCFRPRRTRQ